MPNPDPEHEVRDVPGPADRDVEAPDANPFPEEPRNRYAEKAEQRDGRDEKEPPADRCGPFDGLRDDVSDGVEIRRAQDERRIARDRVIEQFCFRLGQACSPDFEFGECPVVFEEWRLYLPSRIVGSQASAPAASSSAPPARHSGRGSP